MYPNESLSLEMLTKKLVTLLALITAQRVQTLSKICIDNITLLNDTFYVTIPKRIKTTGTNRPQPLIQIPYFHERPALCAASVLKTYLDRTQTLRTQNETYLFLTFKKPHHVATTQTLSRWIKEMLKKGGVETKFFFGT